MDQSWKSKGWGDDLMRADMGGDLWGDWEARKVFLGAKNCRVPNLRQDRTRFAQLFFSQCQNSWKISGRE